MERGPRRRSARAEADAAKDRRDVLAVLSRGEALDVEGVEAGADAGDGGEEGFVPPLVLVEGI